MKKLRMITIIIMLVLFFAVPTFAVLDPPSTAGSSQVAETPSQDDDESTRVKIGDALPEINLQQQDATKVSVQELLKESPVAIVFYRSANW